MGQATRLKRAAAVWMNPRPWCSQNASQGVAHPWLAARAACLGRWLPAPCNRRSLSSDQSSLLDSLLDGRLPPFRAGQPPLACHTGHTLPGWSRMVFSALARASAEPPVMTVSMPIFFWASALCHRTRDEGGQGCISNNCGLLRRSCTQHSCPRCERALATWQQRGSKAKGPLVPLCWKPQDSCCRWQQGVGGGSSQQPQRNPA